MGASLPGARVSLATMGSPASMDSVTDSGESLPSFAFWTGVAGASMRVYCGAPNSVVRER
jgi:hypothetical protein